LRTRPGIRLSGGDRSRPSGGKIRAAGFLAALRLLRYAKLLAAGEYSWFLAAPAEL
jgi:hypothetical protein